MKWWAFGVLLFVVALPASMLVKRNRAEIDRRTMANGDAARCPHCAEMIRPQASVCRFCGRDVTPQIAAVDESLRRPNEHVAEFMARTKRPSA